MRWILAELRLLETSAGSFRAANGRRNEVLIHLQARGCYEIASVVILILLINVRMCFALSKFTQSLHINLFILNRLNACEIKI